MDKYDIIFFINGSVAERLKAAVLKTVVGLPLPEVRILSLPHIFLYKNYSIYDPQNPNIYCVRWDDFQK